MGNHPQESLENIINTTGTLLGVLPIVPWVFGSKNKPPDVADRGHTRQNERLRCQHLLAAPNTHDTLHLLGAIDAIEDSGWGVSGGHVFSGWEVSTCSTWCDWSAEIMALLANLFVVRIGVGHQKRFHNQAHRAVPRGIITGVYIRIYIYINIYSHYKDSLLTVGWPSPM